MFAALALAALLPTADAAPHRGSGHTGVGLGGGTLGGGVSVKHFLTDTSAVQGVVGAWGGWGVSGVGVSADYLVHFPLLADTPELDIGWNAGPGAGVAVFSSGSAWFAASGVVGLELGVVEVPLDIVLEWRPTFLIEPVTRFDLLSFSGHVRWFFRTGQ